MPFKKKRTKKKAAPKKRGAKKKKVGTKPKYQVIHEVRKIGSLTDARRHKKAAKSILDERLDKLLGDIHRETNKTVRNKLLKKKKQLAQEIRMLS